MLSNFTYLLIFACVVIGVILYIGYRAFYEWNLNRALVHKRAYKLPRIWMVLLIYGMIGFLIIGVLVNQKEQTGNMCDPNNDNIIMMANEDNSLQTQISQWMFEYNVLSIDKRDVDDYFDVIIGNSNTESSIIFVTYKLHGISPSDKIHMKVQARNYIVEDEFGGQKQFLQNGDRIYFFFTVDHSIHYNCTARYDIKITVEGKKDLTVEKTIKFDLFTHVRLSS